VSYVSFEYQLSSSTSEPPTGSQVRLNGSQSAATLMWVRNEASNGLDASQVLRHLGDGDLIVLQDWDDSTLNQHYFAIGPATQKVDYVEVPIAHKTGSGAGGDVPSGKIMLTLVHANPPGLPEGGTTDQVLAKASDTDYDAGWRDESTSSGGEHVPGTPYCTPEQVAALLGVPVESLPQPQTDELIALASSVLDNYICDVPEPTPGPVSYVCASLVVRQRTNPTGVNSESVAGYRVQYGSTSAMIPTEDDLVLLGPWLCYPDVPGESVGTRAYTTTTPLAGITPYWPIDWWQRDLDQLDEFTPQPEPAATRRGRP
jgi:hypothetical protein